MKVQKTELATKLNKIKGVVPKKTTNAPPSKRQLCSIRRVDG